MDVAKNIQKTNNYENLMTSVDENNLNEALKK